MGSIVNTAYIIDDDDIYIFGIKKLIQIKQLCKNLLVFNNGQEAIDHIKSINSPHEEFPDIILLDINMPVMDGWEFLDEYAKINPQLKKSTTIYMVSSSINPQDIERAEQAAEV